MAHACTLGIPTKIDLWQKLYVCVCENEGKKWRKKRKA